jgi:hypothetical protein
MNIKVLSRDHITWNIIFFVLLSFLYFHIELALINEVSSFSVELIKKNVLENRTFFSLMVAVILSVYFLKKFSSQVFVAYISFTSFSSIYLLAQEFNKLLLIILFIYIVLAYYYYILLVSELSEPCYSHNFSSYDLFDPLLKKIPIRLKFRDDSVIMGCLVNWNEFGAFIKLDEAITLHDKKVEIYIDYFNVKFTNKAEVVSILKNKTGIGLRIKQVELSPEKFEWGNFFNICDDMGLNAKTLR